MRIHGSRAYPVKCNEVPGQRPSHGADVDGARRRRVPEVRERQVEEVDDDEQLGKPEVAAHPEMQEAEEEQVRRDVVGADVGGCVHVDGVFGVERPGVDELEEEDDDPVVLG